MNIKRRLINFVARQYMLAATLFSGLLLVFIGVALYFRARPLLAHSPLRSVIFGETWLPSDGHFGMKPFVLGTVWVTGLAVVLAVPLCIFASIYLSEYAGPRMRAIIKPIVDLLAGIPSIIYGVWGVLVIVPFVEKTVLPYASTHWQHIHLLAMSPYSTGRCLLSGGIVLAVMVIPVIVSVSDEVLRAVPREMRDVSYALGANRLETVLRVVVRKALPGLIAAIVLGVSRALGETIAVLMVVGNVVGIPHSIFDPAYPLPALIANNYGEVMSIPLYDSALLGAAFMLLVIVLFFNIIARIAIIRAFKEDVGRRWVFDGLFRHLVAAATRIIVPMRRIFGNVFRFLAAMATRIIVPMTRIIDAMLQFLTAAATRIIVPMRRIFDNLFRFLAAAATWVIVLLLFGILLTITAKGYKTLTWSLITQMPSADFNLGGAGGIADAIIGSLYLGIAATLLALVIGLPVVLYLRVYAEGTRLADFVRSSLDVLLGVPSIVFGTFGFVIMMALHLRASLLAGIITVAMLELPIMIRAIDEVARIIPRELDETAYALGSTRIEAAVKVVAKQILPGVVTGMLLAFGRGVGDAASVLFTNGFSSGFSLDPRSPVATLPIAIFLELGTPFETVQNKAYSAALILVIMVLAVSIIARILSARLGKHVIN